MGTEEAVREHQHPGAEPAGQLPGQGHLPPGKGPHGRSEHGMGAALGQGDQAQLGERTLARSPPRPGFAELLNIGGGVGDIQCGAVHAHQPASPPKGARRAVGRQGNAAPGEQLGQGYFPQTGSCLGECRLTGHAPALAPSGLPRQALDQVAHHLLVALRGEQGQGHHVVGHQTGRQQPGAPLLAARLGQNAVNLFGWERPGQHPKGDMIGQPLVVLRLHPSGSRHARENNTDVTLTYGYWV